MVDGVSSRNSSSGIGDGDFVTAGAVRRVGFVVFVPEMEDERVFGAGFFAAAAGFALATAAFSERDFLVGATGGDERISGAEERVRVVFVTLAVAVVVLFLVVGACNGFVVFFVAVAVDVCVSLGVGACLLGRSGRVMMEIVGNDVSMFWSCRCKVGGLGMISKVVNDGAQLFGDDSKIKLGCISEAWCQDYSRVMISECHQIRSKEERKEREMAGRIDPSTGRE
jgi:hypothetical protein